MRIASLIVALLILPAALSAAEWSIETLLAQEHLSEFAVSPDGDRVAWCRRALDETGRAYIHQIFVADLKPDGEPGAGRQLTRHEADATTPRWSPDGRRIAFLSARGEAAEPQVWLLDLRGGEPEAATEAAGGVEDFAWVDAERLLYLAGEGPSLRDTRLEEAEDATRVVEDEATWPATRLFLRDTAGDRTRRVTDNARPILDFAVSPDGGRVAYRVAESISYDYDGRRPPTVRLRDLATGEEREILEPGLRARAFTWDLKSEGFYFLHPVGSRPDQEYACLDHVGYYDLAAASWREVDLEWDRGVGWGGLFATEKGALVDLFDGTGNRLLHVERKGDGWKRRRLPETERGFVDVCAVGPDGKRVVYRVSDASTPPRYFAAELKKDGFKDDRRFLRDDPALEGLPRVRTETIKWAGARGDSVEGLLHYPLDYVEGERRPLVVMVHGGPDGVDQDRFLEGWGGSPGMMAARGAFVLRPNYHGSGGYGLDWVESIIGRYYELEVPDILLGVDRLVELGLADESRLGIQGWSNGAILGIAACIESGQRFRVLDAGAGDVNWTSDFGTCAFGAGFDNLYFGGPPWKIPWTYIDKSPLFRVEELQVPTLISFGADDANVPAEQGWQLFRALRLVDKAPARFVLFPDEGHSLMNPVHRRRQMREQMDWFDLHLFGSFERTNPAFLPGSPLDRALRLTDAARVDGLFGERLDSLLVPELVVHGDLLVGRFEVTRGQWDAWLAATGRAAAAPAAAELDILRERLDPNLPITGVTGEEADAYCVWLSEMTGLECRLPTAAELTDLCALSDGEENTLSWWAGYAPNREDAASLMDKVRELNVNHSLLHTVGTFAPAGETGLYDLAGNAAEWARDAGEEGAVRFEALGAHALSREDPFADAEPADSAYIGFRVVAVEPEGE